MQRTLWIILLASILLMIPAVQSRIDNEQGNRSVMLAGDYDSLTENGLPLSAFGERLEKAGMAATILKESMQGFDMSLMEGLRREGLEIILRLDSLAHPVSYYENLDKLIGRFGIRVLLICPGSDSSGGTTVEQIEYMKHLINKRDLIIFLRENSEQTGYMEVPGLDALIPAVKHRINRAYAIDYGGPFSISPEDAAFVWLRAVVDRSIRLVCIQSPEFNAGGTPAASERLAALLSQKGFLVNRPIRPLTSSIPGLFQRAAAAVNLLAALALYLAYLFPRKKRRISMAAALCLIAVLPFIGFAEVEIGTWAALAASCIYPSLSGLLMLKYLNNSKGKLPLRIASSLGILLFVNGMGALVITASMSGIDYVLHLVNFNLVIPAYLLPLAAFILNFAVCSGKRLPRLIPPKGSMKNGKLLLSHMLYIVMLLLLLFIYLERSGNYHILPKSAAELEARKFLELFMYARPRTKEFMVGYPCLFAFIYLYRKNIPARLLIFLGVLSATTGVSVVNSFCHGFTPVLTSLNRTLNGLLLGIVTGTASVLTCAAVLKVKSSLIFFRRQKEPKY